jgi:hypothetical protein
MTAQPTAPIRAFISYSWSSVTHEDWVLGLANRMMEDGIDVILDKWELQPGRDPIAFMEQMVTNADVKKVLMICDRIYKEKADGREGGVGKEAQILTAEIYEKAAQDKYAALITERDENNKPYVPAYYHSKQYIDFTDVVKHEEKYQELLRWLYDKPQHKKPKLGTAPSFISEPDEVSTATTSKMKQAEQLIKTSNAAAGGAIADFGEAVVSEYIALKPSNDTDEPWDEIVIRTAASLRPAIRNLSELVLAEARYSGVNFSRFLRIFERLGSLMYRQAGVTGWSEDDSDPYRMMCYEGFLATASILIMESRFDLLQVALSHPYLIEGRERGGGAATASFRVFCRDVASFRRRNDRLNGNRIDMYADEIVEIYQSSFPTFQQMFQADLILFLRGQILHDSSGYENWFCRTIIYAGRAGLPELFARSESRRFFQSWAPLIFGPITIEDFKVKVAELDQGTRQMWNSGFMRPSLVQLTNHDHLAQRE